MPSLKMFAMVGVCALAIVGGAVLWLNWYTSLPTVFRSWSSQECLYVIDGAGTKHACGFEEGKKYHLVWVN